ncbi:MAG TPA: class I SAM-dependent methyltransferase [Gemmatimonadales bacterium]|jgi:2-polyprenyl-3-methyl-5-hydroxy-6-metoxy-1,4-benzoquinol methylase
MAADPTDPSNGYETLAKNSIWSRSRSSIGASTVREWARTLPQGATVLDLGCGTGVPISQVLLAEGLRVYGVDASPSMIAAFRSRFPDAPAECRAVEDSEFFGRGFDGVVAWGLMFLLALDVQESLIAKVSRTLKPGGKFMFTSPNQRGEGPDILTGRQTRSPGAGEYRRLLAANGLIVQNEAEDEGDNHYYFAVKGGKAGRR